MWSNESAKVQTIRQCSKVKKSYKMFITYTTHQFEIHDCTSGHKNYVPGEQHFHVKATVKGLG